MEYNETVFAPKSKLTSVFSPVGKTKVKNLSVFKYPSVLLKIFPKPPFANKSDSILVIFVRIIWVLLIVPTSVILFSVDVLKVNSKSANCPVPPL